MKILIVILMLLPGLLVVTDGEALGQVVADKKPPEIIWPRPEPHPAPAVPVLKLPDELTKLVVQWEQVPARLEQVAFYGAAWGAGLTAAVLLILFHLHQKEKEQLAKERAK